MANLYILIVAVLAGALSWLLIGRTRSALLRHQLLDHPNERSSHTQATPRGAGLGILAALLPAWLALSMLIPPPGEAGDLLRWLIPASALVLAAVSFIDDLRGLSQLIRLFVQAIVVIAVVPFLSGPVFQGLLGPIFDTALTVFVWLWFINLFNFMDGIDGIAAVETIGIGIGIYAIGGVFMPIAAGHGQALTVAAAVAGFLWWNWQPARIFLGDVGSVPLGFLLGWLLLTLSASGQWPAALILPGYFLADATVTLIRRFVRHERVWQAHREHYYQQAVARGLSHRRVVVIVLLANLALLALAGLTAAGMVWHGIAGACIVVSSLLFFLGAGRARGDGR